MPAGSADLNPLQLLPLQRRRGIWALPALASVLFVFAMVLMARHSVNDELDERRRTLISDTLSIEAQLHSRIELERAHLANLASRLDKSRHNSATLAVNPEVIAGFQRLWLSVTWLDRNNRILAQVPDRPLPALGGPQDGEIHTGISSHLDAAYAAPNAEAGKVLNAQPPAAIGHVVVRYSPELLLKSVVPWWIKRKYNIRLVDLSDQIMASVDDRAPGTDHRSDDAYRIELGNDIPGATLVLSSHEPAPTVWSTVPVGLVAGFLLLMAIATWLMRRQVRQVMQAESAWRNEVAWRSAMQDSALVGLRARDADGCLLYVNRTFCDMVGLPPERLIGARPPMPYWPADAREEIALRSQRNLAGHAPREGYEATWCLPDGKPLTVMVFESPLIDASGQQIGWMGSILDISARKELAERERLQRERMAQQARLATFGEIASALAHQLNQPLSAISSYNAGVLETLQRNGYDNALVLQALMRQGEQAHEAGRIIQHMREFLSRRTPRRQPLALGPTLRRVVQLLQPDFERLRIQLDWAQEPDLPEVFADQVLVEQLAINLLRNAADALGSVSGVRRIAIALWQADAQGIAVRVDDNGPGLNGRSIEQLCALFHSTKADGMGLGLSICRSVVEVHNGTMQAGSSALGGASLCFTLPLYQPSLQHA